MTEPITLHDELRASARLALPIVLAQLGMMAMGAVDVMMVGRWSDDTFGPEQAIAAIALGHLVTMALLVFGQGVISAIDPLISQALSAGEPAGVRRAIQRGIVLAVGLTVPLSAAAWLGTEPFLIQQQQPESTIPLAVDYVHWSIPGFLPFLVFCVLRQSAQAHSHTSPVLWTILAANLVNWALNEVFIFGSLGGPAMGPAGSAVASTLGRVFMAVLLFALTSPVLGPNLRGWERRVFRVDAIRRMLWIGIPTGLQFLLEIGAFAYTALLVGRFGDAQLSGHQVAINLASLSFMVPLGISIAASVRVGYAVGREHRSEVRQATAVAGLGGVGVMIGFAVLFLTWPAALARLYTDGTAVIDYAAALIPLAGAFQVFDGAQVVASGVLRGMGDTRVPMLVNLVGFWAIGIPLGAWLAFTEKLGPVGLWWGLVAGLAVVAVALSARVAARLRGPIRRLQVDPSI